MKAAVETAFGTFGPRRAGARLGMGILIALAHGCMSQAWAADPTGPFLACASETDDSRRLACFDAAVVDARKQTSVPVAAAAPAAAPVLTKEEKFGLRGDLKQEKAKVVPELAELETLTAKVTKVGSRPQGGLIVSLDNGQVWQEIQAYSGLRVKVGDQVTIKAGALSSYSLAANGRSGKVTRVR